MEPGFTVSRRRVVAFRRRIEEGIVRLAVENVKLGSIEREEGGNSEEIIGSNLTERRF